LRCWCSALVVVVLVTGCGGGRGAKPEPLPDRLARLFEYDRDAPLDVRSHVAARTAHVTVRALTYAAPGGRVPALLIAPRSGGRHAGVIFMHGFGGSRTDFLEEGVGVSLLGAVVVSITSPFAQSSTGGERALVIRNVVDLRRAIDLLVAREDVDPARIGIVGYSLGAQAAALTAAVEDRLRAVILQAPQARPSRETGGDPDLDTVRYVGHIAPAHVFVQGATLDEGVPPREVEAVIDAASGPAQFKWYEMSHTFGPPAFRDQVAWLRDELRLRATRSPSSGRDPGQ
jgi:dienelactone hydrolase